MLTEIDDQIQMVEKKVIAILAEKIKLTAMLSGTRDIPRELRITRELPGLAPWCKYSASARLQVEELTKKQKQRLSSTSLGGFERSCHGRSRTGPGWSSDYCKRKLNTYVSESEFKQAYLVFDQKYAEMRVNEAALIERRRPQKRKCSSEQDERPHPKKQNGERHHRHHRRNGSWQKKAASAKKWLTS